MSKADPVTGILTAWGRWSIIHWKKSFALVLVITAVMMYGISHTELEMTYYSILPKNEKNVRDLKTIINSFPLASGIIAVIDGRGIDDPVKARKAVEDTIDALSVEFKKEAYAPYINNTMGRLDVSLFKKHGLMLSKKDDIERFMKMYDDLRLVPLIRNMNDDFEKEYSGNSGRLSEEEETAAGYFSGLNDVLVLMDDALAGKDIDDERISETLDSYLFGENYMLSSDDRMGLFIIEPTFTMEDIPLMTRGVNAIEQGVKAVASEHNLKGGVTGLTVVGRDEMATSSEGLVWSSAIALVLILGLMVFAFRMFSAPLVCGIPLVTGIIWTVGLSGFIIHRLNIITAMYMVVLLGLGIDYAIHLLTAYVQELESGEEFQDAVINALMKSGSGIIIGALTSAAAFFMLMTAKTEMVSELGAVAGLGILSELAAMMMIIPPLLSYRNYRKKKTGKKENPIFNRMNINPRSASGLGRFLVNNPFKIAVLMVITIAVFSFFSTRVSIETNIMNMEAEGLESIKLQDEMVEEFQMAPDGLSVIENNLQSVKDISVKLEKLSSVKRIDSIAPYTVTEKEWKERLPVVRVFRENISGRNYIPERINREELLDELYRLEDNLLELSDLAYLGNMKRISLVLERITGRNNDGDKVGRTAFDMLYDSLENDASDYRNLENLQLKISRILKKKLIDMSSEQKVGIDTVPVSIRDSYVSEDKTKFLVSIVPVSNPWEGDFREVYTAQVGTVTDKATGMILAGDQLSTMARIDGLRSSAAAVAVIFLILLLDFRNLKLVIFTMIPLAASFLVLFGIMGIFDIKFDFVNIIAVPLLIGIGIDDAVHINHRYLMEGKGSMSMVIGSTGTALLLTSITTIIGFASFIPSPMRAMKSTGIVLSLAMAIAFINSILLHPSILIIAAEKLKLNIRSWTRGGSE